MVFVDTDFLIACVRSLVPKKPVINAMLKKARKMLESLTNAHKIVKITIFNYAELYKGVYLSKNVANNLRFTDKFLEQFEIIPFSAASAKEYGRISADLDQKGQKIGDSDIFIASIVLMEDDILYTHNTAHFSKIPLLKLLDWTGSEGG